MEMFRSSGLTTGVIKLAWRRASDTDGSGTALEDSDTVNNSTLSVGDYSGGNYNWGTVTFNFDGTNAIEAGDYFLTNVTVASGNDIKNRVMLTVVVSTQVPCFLAAKNPMGIPKTIDIILAANPSCIDIHNRLLMSSFTLLPLYLKLSPKSPFKTLPM